MNNEILGDFTTIKTGKLDANASSENGEYPFFTCSSKTLRIDNYSYDCECVLVAGNGDLNVKYYNGKFNAYQRTYIIESKDKYILNPKYMYYLISSKIEELRKKSIGGVIKYIKLNNLTDIIFKPIEFEKQIEIVRELDKIYELIGINKKQIQLLEELTKAEFLELFGDPILNEKGWRKTRLDSECNIITGNTPSRKKTEYYGDFIEWIKSDNINTPSNFITTAEEFLSEEGAKVGRCVEKDSILMTCIAGSINCIGNVAMTDRKVAFNQQINGIETLEHNTWFMYIQFILAKKYIQSTINMSLKGILSKSKLSELEFIFPPIELQNQFANIVKRIDKQKEIYQENLVKLEELKNGLMNKYFN